jgi:Rnl2 family RNA ligase
MGVSKIKTIRKIGKLGKRYDIEVEDTHCFFANGILVHNSNFSYITDGEEFKVAKRTSITDGGFYNCQVVIDRYQSIIEEMFAYIQDLDHDVNSIQVYGELYGGYYEGYKSQVKAIQKGVQYNPDIDVYFFDIRKNYDDISIFADFDEKVRIFEKFNLMYSKELFRGSFKEALEYPNEYNSHIPEWLGLPTLEKNICEGNVILPVTERRFRTGERVVLKNKNEKWSEKSNKSRAPKVPEVVPEHIQEMVSSIGEYITENRLRNVLSKIDPNDINQKSFGLITGKLSQDAIEDFMKDNPEFVELEKADRKRVTKVAGKLSAELLRPVFLNVIDFTF